jgi:predicted nucleic acid-binding protein
VREAVLADAGPLYAAVDPSDAHHGRAIQELQQLEQRQIQVIVSFSTLLETYSLVVRRLGRNVAFRWLREVREATLVNPTPEDYRQAIAKVGGFADQSITLFDATVAVLASRIGVRVWTYDHHFAVMRVPVWR